MRKLDLAKANFIKAYNLQPDNLKVVNELTKMYFDYRQCDKAVELANKCVGCESAARILGLCSDELKNYMAAEKALLQVIKKTLTMYR
ncbi:MAG: hypothetical protein ACKVOM_07965 [Ferruginibacter sp.]